MTMIVTACTVFGLTVSEANKEILLCLQMKELAHRSGSERRFPFGLSAKTEGPR